MEVEGEIAGLYSTIGGIKDIRRLPDAVFLIDITVDKIAVTEAKRKNIPLIAIVDSNANPELIDYPVPANDDAVKSIELISNVIADAVIEGKESAPAPEPAASEEA